MKYILLFCFLQLIVSVKAVANTTYILHSPLNIQRYFTTKIINKLQGNKFEIIEFDSSLNLLSHYYFEQESTSMQCTKEPSVELSTKGGNAYKYWLSGSSFSSCAISATDFFQGKHDNIKANTADLNVIVLPKPQSVKPDLYIPTNTKITPIFKLISLVKFNHSHPEISKILIRNQSIVVGKNENTYQLLLIKRN